jgi:transposase
MSMRKLKEVLRLKWACGLTHRQISQAIGISVGAVSKFAAQAAQAGLDWATAEALSDDELEARLNPVSSDAPAAASRRLEPDYGVLHRELRRKGVTLQLLWEEYVEGNPGLPTYRYTQFCQKYKDWAASLKRSMRQQHRAGEKLFADFAGQSVPILARDGGIALQAHVFVAVLGASNYTFACATASETTADWIGGLCDALEFIGGVPELLVPDNPKALIALADRYEPVLGRTAQDFVNHYATAMLPARPRKPQDKAKVEVGVKIVERWVLARLRHHRFYSLAELNKAIANLIAELNRRPFKRLDGTRREWFERLDQPALRPLPARRYEVASFQKCRVNILCGEAISVALMPMSGFQAVVTRSEGHRILAQFEEQHHLSAFCGRGSPHVRSTFQTAGSRCSSHRCAALSRASSVPRVHATSSCFPQDVGSQCNIHDAHRRGVAMAFAGFLHRCSTQQAGGPMA